MQAVEGLRDCAVYSYKAELDSDPFGEQLGCFTGYRFPRSCHNEVLLSCGLSCIRLSDVHALQPKPPLTRCAGCTAAEDGNVWSFNFFFYNKRRKKILYFSCRGISKAVTGKDGSNWASCLSPAVPESYCQGSNTDRCRKQLVCAGLSLLQCCAQELLLGHPQDSVRRLLWQGSLLV